MLGTKGSGSSIFGIGLLISIALVFVFRGVEGFFIGMFLTVCFMVYSNIIYNETPQMIVKNRTMKEKRQITALCKTPDEAHDKLFFDQVAKAAYGFARKKRLAKPNGECYKLAIRSYTTHVMYSSETGYPESLKEKGIYMCYYKPIYRKSNELFDSWKYVQNFGRIFVYGIDNNTIYKINVPNLVYEYKLNKYRSLETNENLYSYNEIATTKISDPRITMEDVLRM